MESGDSKKNLKSKSQIRGMVERIGVCVGLYLTHWFSETLPCSACSDISLLGSNSFWNAELKWGKPEPLLTGNANWRPCEPGETIRGPRKYSRRHSNWKSISKTKTGSDPALWSSSSCSSTLCGDKRAVKGACQLASRRKTEAFWENCYIAYILLETLWHRWKGGKREARALALSNKPATLSLGIFPGNLILACSGPQIIGGYLLLQ